MAVSQITIPEQELVERFVRSSGPGGQNVNKVATAVQLRFDARRSPSLPNDVAIRLMRLAGSKLTKDGVIVITADTRRSQNDNRADAVRRLVDLVSAAAERPKARIATRPSAGEKARRADSKVRRGAVKTLRGRVDAD